MEQPCKNCGYDIYELLDGHYYCLECHEEFADYIDKTVEVFDNDNIIFDTRGGIKQKDANKEEEKRKTAIESKCTSFEEYNFILRGLVDEILMIEDIPNFKRTVLQLWIHYLKSSEVAFFDKDQNHLPKFHAYYRQQDAQILYNKRPIKRKRKVQKKPVVEVKIEDDTKEGRKLKRRSSRKSLKKIQQMNTEEEEESFVSSNTSTLTNLTVEDIEATMLGQELNIEFSKAGKEAKENFRRYKTARNMDVKTNLDGDVDPKRYKFKRATDTALVLTGKTLLFIIFSALNICGSTIQFTDLMRFVRDGHISYWNFRKHLPEKLEDTKLSLQQFHSMFNANYYSMHTSMQFFLMNFPEIRTSLKTPNLNILVSRYVDDLNLPTCLVNHVEKLMELLPSKLKYPYYLVPNFEGRAMAYLLFILKLVFGIDGYREKEISKSAKKINSELKSQSIHHKLFNYEAWRECIEYRDVILNKYYFPTLNHEDFSNDRPYEHYVSTINAVKPETFRIYTADDKMNKYHREYIHKKATTKELLHKLMNLHIDDDPAKNLTFKCSMTPLKDALDVILNSPLEVTVNRCVLEDFSNDSLEFFFEPEKLVQIFEEHEIELTIKPSTFPKNFSFQKCEYLDGKNGMQKMKISHDTINQTIWLKNMIQEEKNKMQKEIDVKVGHHHRNMSKMIEKRFNVKNQIDELRNEENNTGFDEVVAIHEDQNESLTFVYPDFNLWHRKIHMNRQRLRTYKEDIRKLPKSMLWLLNTASKVIQQPIDFIYYELMLLENEFIDVHQPLELTNHKLELKKNQNITCKTLHKFW